MLIKKTLVGIRNRNFRTFTLREQVIKPELGLVPYSVIQVLGVDLGLDSFRKMEQEVFFLAPFCTTRMYILSSRATDLWL